MINAKEKELSSMDSKYLFHFIKLGFIKLIEFFRRIFFFCSPRPEPDDIERNVKITPKKLLKHSVSRVSSLLGVGFARETAKVVHDKEEEHLTSMELELIPPNAPRGDRKSWDIIPIAKNLTTTNSKTELIGKDLNEGFYKPSTVMDIENGSDEESDNSSPSPTSSTAPQPSQTNTKISESVSSQSISSNKPPTEIHIDTTKTSRKGSIIIRPQTNNDASPNPNKTIITIEDDEVAETPHLTTKFGEIFPSSDSQFGLDKVSKQ